MSMDELARIEGPDLKIKVDEGMWSPPIGHRDSQSVPTPDSRHSPNNYLFPSRTMGHTYRGDGRSGCDVILNAGVRCGAGRALHPEGASR